MFDVAGNRKVIAVDFIEGWLGISPDGGDGSIEITFLVMSFFIIAVAWRVFLAKPENKR